MEISIIYSIGHQAAGIGDLNRIRVYRGQSVAGREFAHSGAFSDEYALCRCEKSVNTLPDSSVKRSRKVIGTPDILNLQGYTQRRGRCLQCVHL